MRTLIVHVPGWLNLNGPSLHERPGPNWGRLVAGGRIRRLPPIDGEGLVEAAWLGIEPTSVEGSPGVLTVAALGADPPERSVHFAVTPLVMEDGQLRRPVTKPTPEERRAFIGVAKRLDTSKMSFVEGPLDAHGLVLEDGSIELGTTEPDDVGDYRASLPEGDGETVLRRWIDDGINLLREAEFNRIREAEGIEMIDTLWPWGPGFRGQFPNLPIRYGAPIRVVGGSMRIQGLARLCGCRLSGGMFGEGTNTRLEQVATSSPGVQIGLIEAFQQFDAIEQEAERRWLTDEMDRRLWNPLIGEEDLQLLVTAITPEGGLVLHYDSRQVIENSVPFAERVLDDRTVHATSLADAVRSVILP